MFWNTKMEIRQSYAAGLTAWNGLGWCSSAEGRSSRGWRWRGGAEGAASGGLWSHNKAGNCCLRSSWVEAWNVLFSTWTGRIFRGRPPSFDRFIGHLFKVKKKCKNRSISELPDFSRTFLYFVLRLNLGIVLGNHYTLIIAQPITAIITVLT